MLSPIFQCPELATFTCIIITHRITQQGYGKEIASSESNVVSEGEWPYILATTVLRSIKAAKIKL